MKPNKLYILILISLVISIALTVIFFRWKNTLINRSIKFSEPLVKRREPATTWYLGARGRIVDQYGDKVVRPVLLTVSTTLLTKDFYGSKHDQKKHVNTGEFLLLRKHPMEVKLSFSAEGYEKLEKVECKLTKCSVRAGARRDEIKKNIPIVTYVMKKIEK